MINLDIINLMSDISEKISEICEEIKMGEDSKREKISFIPTVSTYVEQLFRCLEHLPDSNIKRQISNLMDNVLEKSTLLFSEFTQENLDSLKEIISTLNKNLGEHKIAIETKEDNIKLYTKNLEIYKESVEEYKKNLELYKSGKIAYEICQGKHIYCSQEYKKLNELYKKIDDTNLEKPKRPVALPKDVKDLELKNFLEEVERYNDLLGVYELDYFTEYVKIAEDYDKGKISYEKYNIAAVECANVYFSIKNYHDEIMKDYADFVKKFDETGEYIMVSEEEIMTFILEKEEYEKHIVEYKQAIQELEELYIKLEQGMISEEEYEAKQKSVDEMLISLQHKQKHLKDNRKRIYNSATLSRLKKYVKLLEEYSNQVTLTGNAKEALEAKMAKLTLKIKEIEKFKSSLVIKEITKKTTKKVTVKRTANDIIGPIEEPSEFFYLGKKKQQKPEPEPEVLGLLPILYKICGDYKYNAYDNFIYTHKDIKLVSWQKSNARTFLDKPMKLMRTGLGVVINVPTKIYSKFAYHLSKDTKVKIDSLINNINKLTEKELDFLIENLTADEIRNNRGILPDVAWNALYKRMAQRIHLKVSIANKNLEKILKDIISNYKTSQSIKNNLDNEDLMPEQRKEKTDELERLSKLLCDDINQYDAYYHQISNLANASGLEGMRRNFIAKDNIVVGGVNARKFHDPVALKSGSIIETTWRREIAKNDGITAAEYFLLEHKFKMEETRYEKTLKNRFGSASVGAFEYSPFVKFADYSENTYLRDVMQSVIIISGIFNAVNQLQIRNELNVANQTIQMQNAQIDALNKQISDLQQLALQSTPAQEEFLDVYYNVLQGNVSTMQPTIEYLSMSADAGTKTTKLVSGGVFQQRYDDMMHTMTGDCSRELESIYNDSILTPMEKIDKMSEVFQPVADKYCDTALSLKPGVDTHLQAFGNTDDFRALEEIFNTLGTNNPTYVSNMYQNLYQIAQATNNLSVINKLAEINVNVPILPQLIPILGVVGYETYEKMKKDMSAQKPKSEEELIKSAEEEIKKLLSELEIKVDKVAQEKYDKKKEEWDKKGNFYKWINKKEMPKKVEEVLEVLEEQKGRSL